jgi:hypothetical protein
MPSFLFTLSHVAVVQGSRRLSGDASRMGSLKQERRFVKVNKGATILCLLCCTFARFLILVLHRLAESFGFLRQCYKHQQTSSDSLHTLPALMAVRRCPEPILLPSLSTTLLPQARATSPPHLRRRRMSLRLDISVARAELDSQVNNR